MNKPSIAIDSSNLRILTYEEAYKVEECQDEIDHLRTADPGCYCPICEEERRSIQSERWLMKAGII